VEEFFSRTFIWESISNNTNSLFGAESSGLQILNEEQDNVVKANVLSKRCLSEVV
jgi:hypothetical protein